MLNNALTLPHLLLIAVVVLVLFGKGKVASLMGEVGRGMTAFKRGMTDETAAAEQTPDRAPEVLPPAQGVMADKATDKPHA
ncbi:MAG TPA: twin-arginine translocase TatA/TatE family subunit [Paenirhodobacter sp.]